MNKPATKEPSMDEILSSIRQIIADDDAAAAPAPAPTPPPAVKAAAIPPRPVVPPVAPPPASAPLPLSTSQIVGAKPVEPEPARKVESEFAAIMERLDTADAQPAAGFTDDEPDLVDPEDIAFETEETAPLAKASPPPPEPRLPPRSVAQAAPMPDPTLASDMAEQLLAPAVDAAVQANIARLAALSSPGIGSITVEAMMRDMLRPMLKDWLDENLPSLVERMVEREIARISRGVK